MSVIDFTLTKYVSDSNQIAEKFVKEAEDLLDEDGKTAGLRAVEAWLVLNGAAVVATRIGATKQLTRIRITRNKIMAMGAALEDVGISMITNVPETSFAYLVQRKEPQ